MYPEYFLELYAEEDERAESGIDAVPEEKPEAFDNLPDLEDKPEEPEEESANKPKEKVDSTAEEEPEVLPAISDPAEEVSEKPKTPEVLPEDDRDADDDEAWSLSQ